MKNLRCVASLSGLSLENPRIAEPNICNPRLRNEWVETTNERKFVAGSLARRAFEEANRWYETSVIRIAGRLTSNAR